MPEKGESVSVRYDFQAPATLRSATLAYDGGATTFSPARFRAILEVSEDGVAFRRHAEFPAGVVPQYTIAFPPVAARAVRIRFEPNPADGIKWTPAEGAVAIDLLAASRARHAELRVDRVTFSATPRAHRFEEKAGFEAPFDYFALDAPDPSAAGVDPAAVLDLTDRLRPDGTLAWTPPALPNGRRWTLMRFGWSLTGKVNHPATAEATGLEVDKYDADAVARYMEHYLGTYAAAVGPGAIGAKGIRAFLNDSIEVGAANWTPKLLDAFKARRGYDMRPWMPALAGQVVGTAARTDAFLYDFRRTLGDLIAESHYGVIARMAKARGLRTYAEALEFGRPSLGDDLAMRSHADVPMAAMWTWPDNESVRPVALADMRGAASVANLYGQNIAALEALTSAMSPWAFAPRHLRPMIDLAFANGINLPVIHTSVHQPRTDRAPGLSLSIFGQHFNRLETWAEVAKPWIDYMARTSFLLQQGRSVAGALYFTGEEAPLTALYNGGLPADAPRTHDYDFATADILARLRAEGGEVAAPSGARYRLLWLGGQSDRMTVPTLRRVLELVRAGATVAGKRASRSPSLADDPAEFRALADALWGAGEGVAPRAVGRGRVLAAADADDALRQIGAAADVDVGGADLLWKHRLLPDGGHIYFLTNRTAQPLALTAALGVSGFRPERWDAVTGRAEALGWASAGGVTRVPLALGPQESTFVLFRERTAAAAGEAPTRTERELARFAGGWTLRAPGVAARPAAVGTWTDDPAMRHFSGTADYLRALRIDAPARGERVLLDLGDVGDVAEVLIDGRSAGIAWTAPWRVDVTDHLRPGRDQQLTVRVTNRWINRLIGDAQPGAQRTSFTAVPAYRPDAPLRPSGLLRPVRLVAERREEGK